MSVKCPNCGWGIPPASATCPVCGASLQAGPPTEASPQGALEPQAGEPAQHAAVPPTVAAAQMPQQQQMAAAPQAAPAAAAIGGVPPVDTLRLDDVLKSSVDALVKNVGVIGPIALICMLPAFLIEVGLAVALTVIMGSDMGTQTGDLFERLVQGDYEALRSDPVVWFWTAFAGLYTVAGFVRMALKFVAQAAVIFVIVEFLAGRKATVADGLRTVGNRILPVMIAAFVVTLLVFLGFAACVIPGVLIMCVFFVAIPAAVAEKVGPFTALGRSVELTRGHRVTIFLALLLLFVAAWMLGSCGGCFGGSLGSLGAVIAPSPGTIVGMLYSWGFELIYTMFVASMGAIVYARLRGIHDGIDAESLASVFA